MATVSKPAEDERTFWRGEIVFDRKRTDILSDPLVVTDHEVQTLEQLKHTDSDTYVAVKHNDTNREMANLTTPHGGLPDDTPIVEVAFIDGSDDTPSVEGRTYTYPTFRLMRVVGSEDSDLPEYRPPMMSAAEIVTLVEEAIQDGGIESVDELHLALMESQIDGEVLAAARQLRE